MKKPKIIAIAIVTIILIFFGFWAGSFVTSKNIFEHQRCEKFGSDKTNYIQESCYSAGCIPDSPGGEWGCIPKPKFWF